MRGPVNQPVQLASFADYRRVFGGLWEAGTLSYAVAHFFANGGRQAIITNPNNIDRAIAGETGTHIRL